MKTILPLLVAALTWLSASAADGPSPLVTRKQDELLAVLKSDAGVKAKADACRELTVVGTAEAIPSLVALLNDDKLAHMARYALEAIPGPAVEAALRAQLTKLEGRRLAGVICSLGVRRDKTALEAMARHLLSSDPNVVSAAAWSVGNLGTPEAAEALFGAITDPADPNIVAFADGLCRCAERLVAAGNKDAALQIYSRYNEPGLPHQVKTAALRGAILVQGKQGLELIREHVRGEDPVFFATAIRVAYEIKDPEITSILAGELPKLSTDRRIVVMQALGGRGDAAAVTPLLAAAKTGDPGLRATAIRAAGELGQPSSVGAFVELMADPNRDVSNAAQDALAAVPGAEADQAVLKLFTAADTKRRLAGIDLIARRRMLNAVPDLLKVATDPDAQVRAAALRRLGELAARSDLAALLDLVLKAVDGRDIENAEEAAAAVAARVNPAEQAAGQVAAKLAAAKPASKAALVRILTTLGGATALQNVRAAVKDSNEEVRSTAIRSLGAWRTTEAAPDLLELARSASDEKTRLLCLRSYLGMAANTDLPAKDRLDMCRKGVDLVKTDDEKKLLLAALGGIPTMNALALVVPHLGSAVKGEAAAAALAIIPKVMQDQAALTANAPKLAEALEKVVPAATNPDQEQRAKTLLKQVQAKMGNK